MILDLIMWEWTCGRLVGRIPQPIVHEPNLACVIQTEVIGLQSELDAANVPLGIHDKIFKRLCKKKADYQHGQPQDYTGMGIAQLVATAGKIIF